MEHVQALNSVWSVIFGIGTFIVLITGLFWKIVGHGIRLDDHNARIKTLEESHNHETLEFSNRLTMIETTQKQQSQTLEKIDKKLDKLAEDGCYRANEFHGGHK